MHIAHSTLLTSLNVIHVNISAVSYIVILNNWTCIKRLKSAVKNILIIVRLY